MDYGGSSDGTISLEGLHDIGLKEFSFLSNYFNH